MAKQLKKFNGRGHGKYERGHIYVAAYSVAQAAKLVSAACFGGREDLVSVHEINEYYNKNAWGNSMDGIEPTEPTVWASKEHFGKPHKVI